MAPCWVVLGVLRRGGGQMAGWLPLGPALDPQTSPPKPAPFLQCLPGSDAPSVLPSLLKPLIHSFLHSCVFIGGGLHHPLSIFLHPAGTGGLPWGSVPAWGQHLSCGTTLDSTHFLPPGAPNYCDEHVLISHLCLSQDSHYRCGERNNHETLLIEYGSFSWS